MSANELDLQIGMTCTFGSGKTVWEIVKVNHKQDGTIKDLHLSKYLGDGYTNRWAQVSEIRNLHPQVLRVSLATILTVREEAEKAAKALQDAIRMKAHPERLDEVLTRAWQATTDYSNLYELHIFDVKQELES